MVSRGDDSDGAAIPEDATVSVRPIVEAPSTLVGRTIASKYVVRELLGRGGMGLVVRAHHLALDQPVALKFLLGATPTAGARFQREARIVFQLTGEHIVRLFDVGTLEDGAPYLVMQFVQGETLAQRLAREGPLTIPTAIDFVLQACVGVAEAHRAAIVHRDLKPSNLMLTTRADGSPLVKVLDFGIAKIVGPLESSADAHAAPASVGAIARLRSSPPEPGGLAVADTVSSERPDGLATRATAVVGSPYYMSPEQIERPADVDARSDVWALGVVLHELVSGKVPFDGVSVADVAVAITERTPALSFGDDAPGRALDAVVRKCLARDPADRFHDVGELAAALAPIAANDAALALAERAARVLAHAPLSAPALSPRSPIVRTPAVDVPQARRSPRYAVVGIVAVAVGASVALVAWRTTRESPTAAPPVGLAGAASASGPPASSADATRPPEACPPDMILVPAGTFTMGRPDGAGVDRAFVERQVELGAYCIDRTEVTVDAYQRCVDASGGCTKAKTTAEFRATTTIKPISLDACNAGIEDRARHPINCVDWNQAQAYCKWVTGGRGMLPTEAQWERAARGTDARRYPWGADAPSVDLVNGNDEAYAKWRAERGLDAPKKVYDGSDGWPTTAPVGSFPKGASPIGALDMAGNVCEWVADYYAPYDRTASVDPYRATLDPGRENAHPVRGGAWSDDLHDVYQRTGRRAHIVYPDLGFRCAAPPN